MSVHYILLKFIKDYILTFPMNKDERKAQPENTDDITPKKLFEAPRDVAYIVWTGITSDVPNWIYVLKTAH